jgi:hypothetical protein
MLPPGPPRLMVVLDRPARRNAVDGAAAQLSLDLSSTVSACR